MPKYCFLFTILIGFSFHSFSQTDCKQYFFENNIGQLDAGLTPPKLFTASNGDVIFGGMKGDSFVVAKLNYRGDSIWDKIYFIPGGFYSTYSRGLQDIDGNLLFAVAPNYFIKLDTAGNIIGAKSINNIGMEVIDMVMLKNGDKLVLFQKNSLAEIVLLNADLSVTRWCKAFYAYSYYFTNLVVDSNIALMSGAYTGSVYPYTSLSFITKFNLADGSVIQNQTCSLPNNGLSFTDILKCGSDYIAVWTTDNNDFPNSNRGYTRFDAQLNVKKNKRITNYSVNYSSPSFVFQGMPDGSFYYAFGESFNLALGHISSNDTLHWVKDVPGDYSNPSDLKLSSNKNGLYIAGNQNYFAVGINLYGYTAYVLLCDLNGNFNVCTPETTPTTTLPDANVNTALQPFPVADSTLSIDNVIVSGIKYAPEESAYCKSVSSCDSIHIKGDSAICNVMPALFTATRNKNCTSPVYWSVVPSSGAAITYPDDTTLSVVFNNSGNYHVAAYILRPCGDTVHDSFAVHVNLLPNLNLGVDTFICSNSSLVLHAGNQFESYKWQDGSIDSLYKVTAAGQYFVTVKDYCNNTFSDTININDVTTVAFHVMNDTTKCNNDSIRFTAPAGFLSYRWSPDYSISNDTGKVVDVFPDTTVSYIASAFTSSGCNVSDTIHITVNHSPKIILGNDTSICSGQTIILNAGNRFNNYLWNTGDTTRIIKVLTAGAYSVKATDGNQCISKDTFNLLNVYPLPLFSLGNDTTLCDGNQLSYNFTISQQASYLWNTGSTSNIFNINSAGTYWLQVTSQMGCIKSDSIQISYQPSPVITLGNDTTLCKGNNYVLNAFYPGSSYTWQDGATSSQYTVTVPGLYHVAVNLNGCIAKDTIDISYLDKPFFNLGKDTVLCEGTTITLHPQLNTNASYTWQDASNSSTYLVKGIGTYELTVTNECGTFSDEIIITPGLCNIEMPNVFTPNGDGLNDVFRVKYPFTVRSFLFTVYNRFGQKMFETTDMTKGWDGNYQSQPQPMGSYVWLIQLTADTKPAQSYKGVINLIR